MISQTKSRFVEKKQCFVIIWQRIAKKKNYRWRENISQTEADLLSSSSGSFCVLALTDRLTAAGISR